MMILAFSLAGAEKEPESAEAIVTMNDGTALSGTLTIIGSNPLTISPQKEKRQKQFLFQDIVSIENKVETSEMLKPWVYKEAGKTEKYYFDEKEYPFINFLTRITLVDGSVVTGHIISAAFNFKTSEGKQKIFLQRQLKGDKGQEMKDVTYPSMIQFPGNKAKDAAQLKGTVEGLGRLLKVSALDVDRELVLAAKVSEGNKFDFGNLLPGRYDIYVFTDTHVLAGFSGDIPSNIKEKRPLQDGDFEAIKKVFPKTDDFFKVNERWLLKLDGSKDYAKTLAYKRRADYVDDMGKPVHNVRVWHLEVMTWHVPESEWQLDKRFIMIRHKQQEASEKNRKLFIAPSLGGVKPGTELKINEELINGDKGFIQNLE